jgi:uncharacterized membrane protein YeaQ/YmgE (transglycosylase-associated protein family)
MSVFALIVLGLVAGFVGDLILGIAGAVVGVLVFGLSGSGLTALNLYSLVVAVVGAAVVLFVFFAFRQAGWSSAARMEDQSGRNTSEQASAAAGFSK